MLKEELIREMEMIENGTEAYSFELFFVTDEDIWCECQESRPDFVERYDKMSKEEKMKFLSRLSKRMKDTFEQSRRFDWRQLVLDGLAWVEEDEQQESSNA